jgi:hypothetical protein
MPYFARLNSENVVTFVERLIGVADGDAEGQAFLKNLYGTSDTFKFCKYDGTVRKNYPGVGYTFDEARDAFIPPRPGEDWTLDEDTCRWIDPNPPESRE